MFAFSHFADIARAGRPAVIAHRGASRAARENTVEAFRRAATLGADAVELDVRRTLDGALLVHHDPEVDGLGPLVERPRREWAHLAPWIPTLGEALDACGELWSDVEVKNLPHEPDWDPDHHVAARVVDAVVERGAAERTLVSSFNPDTLARVRERAAEEGGQLATALVTMGFLDAASGVEAAAEGGHVACAPGVEALRDDAAAVVARARELGVAVVPWTVDDPDEIAALAAAGVAGLITNTPDLARSVLG